MSVISKAAGASLLIFMTATGNAQVLFTYGGKAVTKTDFLKAYNKNNFTVLSPATNKLLGERYGPEKSEKLLKQYFGTGKPGK